MPFTNEGANFVSLMLGSKLQFDIGAIEVGTGSGTASVTDKTLVAGSLRNILTGSPNFTNIRKVQFQADFNSVEMSGMALTEFGLFTSGPVLIGSTMQRESFGSVIFDGTNELQILSTLEVIPG